MQEVYFRQKLKSRDNFDYGIRKKISRILIGLKIKNHRIKNNSFYEKEILHLTLVPSFLHPLDPVLFRLY